MYRVTSAVTPQEPLHPFYYDGASLREARETFFVAPVVGRVGVLFSELNGGKYEPIYFRNLDYRREAAELARTTRAMYKRTLWTHREWNHQVRISIKQYRENVFRFLVANNAVPTGATMQEFWYGRR